MNRQKGSYHLMIWKDGVMGEGVKNCPFCGGKASTFHIPGNGTKEMLKHPKWEWKYPGLWVVGCDTPMCMGNINHFTMVFINEGSAIEAWNRRVRIR